MFSDKSNLVFSAFINIVVLSVVVCIDWTWNNPKTLQIQ